MKDFLTSTLDPATTDRPQRIEWVGFAVRRLIRLVILLAAVAVASFALMMASPVDPVRAYIGAEAARIGPEQRGVIAEAWGFDQPPLTRFLTWLGHIVRGDLGESIVFNQPVAQVIGDRLSTSLGLLATAWLLSGLIGFAMGVTAGMNRGRWVDRALTWWSYTLASAPTFWVALLLLYVFAVWLQIAPVCCAAPVGMLVADVTLFDRLQHLILPALTLSMVGVAPIVMHTRQVVIDIHSSDHLAYARALGERGWGLIWYRVLREASVPAIILSFASFGELFGGAILAEQVFSYPGLGQATTTAALRQDVPLLLGIALFTTVFVFVGNLLGDIAHRLIDPRVRLLER